MATDKKKIIKILVIIACVLSLLVFLLEITGTILHLREKLLSIYDYNGQNKLIFVNVADGNSAIIQSGEHTAIINFGGVDDGGNAVLKAIRKYRITKVDYAFITIADSEHLGGFMAVSELVDINKVIIPNLVDFEINNTVAAQAVKDKILKDNNYDIVELNKSYMVGEFSVTPFYYKPDVLFPTGNAVLYKVSAFNNSAIIGGNFHDDIMYELLANNPLLTTDIFLMSGFSDINARSLPFLESIKAKYIVSSSAYKNDSFSQEDLLYLEDRFNLYRTDIDGDITFYFKDSGLSVLTER